MCLCKAQSPSPLIKGNVEISITKGTIACDLLLSDLPDVKNYVIRLNSGMNLHYFKDVRRSKLPLYYDSDTSKAAFTDETKAYFVYEKQHQPARYLPAQLEVKYVGMYPVSRDPVSGYMVNDWRGNIAFNGYSIRAEGLQGCWYPTLYDKDTRKLYTEVRYDINVTCSDCSVLFVNGSKPVRSGKNTFTSDVPYEMAMYCGRFKTSENKGIWLLNSDMKKEDEQKLFNIADAYQTYYSKQMGIPFKGNHTFVQTSPVTDPHEKAFAFYASPTTINVGIDNYGLASMFDKENSTKSKKMMAHELAHYYFGTLLKSNVEFGHIIEEGFAEYLALTLTRSIEGEAVYRNLLQDKINSLKQFSNYKPLAQAITEHDYGNREYYLYNYTPVLLTAIEKEIGQDNMWTWLKRMVTTKPGHTDYQFILNTFKLAVPDATLQEKVIGKYFSSAKALDNAKAEIGL